MGGVAHLGPDRHASGDVGGGAQAAEIEADALTPATRPGPPHRDRCRRELCIARVAAHKKEVAELKGKLLPLQRTFNTLVQGEARRADVELLEARKRIAQLEELRRDELRLRRCSDRAARSLLEENELLLAKVGELSASNASLIGKHAAGVRKAMLEKRQAVAREKQLRADVARAEQKVEVAKEGETEAKQAEVEAEQRAQVAEELQANAEARADEAIQEAKCAAEAAADAAEEVSDAAYVAAVLIRGRPKTQPFHAATRAAAYLN